MDGYCGIYCMAHSDMKVYAERIRNNVQGKY